MRDRHAMPEAGAAKLLAAGQAVEHVTRREHIRTLGQQRGQFFERLLLAGHRRAGRYPLCHENLTQFH